MEPDFDDFLNGFWSGESAGAQPWIEWVHRNLGASHCEVCLHLDQRWFCADKHPVYPHHPHCHCILREIPYGRVRAEAEAVSDLSKFDHYIFNATKEEDRDKEILFRSWGFRVEDAPFLLEEFVRQGLEKYRQGEYKLGKLDKHGQRISIRVMLIRKDNGHRVSFVTGWMVDPKGRIHLAAPYGGK